MAGETSDQTGTAVSKEDYRDKIDAIFKGHYKTIKEDYSSVIREIDEWSSKCVQLINEHVVEQKRLLVDAFTNRKQFLKKQCEEINNLVNNSSGETEKSSLDELCEKFRNLNVQYWELTRVKYEWNRLEVIIKLEPEETRTADSAAALQNARRRRRQHNREHTQTDTNKTSSEKQSSDSTSPNPNHTNHSHVDETQSGANDSLIDDSTDRCPICYMIYPKGFTSHDRRVHVNAHMDDEPN